MRLITWIVLAVALFYVVLVAGLYLLQRNLMYHPNDARPDPRGAGIPGLEVVSIEGSGGASLYSWWLPPSDPNAPVVLYFHGNAGDLADRTNKFHHYRASGLGMLMPSYRYNAGGGGAPSEAALIADGRRAAEWLRGQGIAADRILLHGESLGSGVAMALAAEGLGAAVVIEGGYEAISEVAASIYWYAPVRMLIKDRFDSRPRAKNSTLPILIVHGAGDRVVPRRHAEALFQAANEPKELVILDGGGHVDLYDHGMKALVDRFVARYLSHPDQ